MSSSRHCRDPECSGTAEPEQDGDVEWLECVVCGYGFDHVRLTADRAPSDDVCAAGIPEAVRRRASQVSQAPLLQIGRRDAGAA